MTDDDDLAYGEDGSPTPALHHHHAEHVARNVNQDTKLIPKWVQWTCSNSVLKEEVCVGVPRETCGCEG